MAMRSRPNGPETLGPAPRLDMPDLPSPRIETVHGEAISKHCNEASAAILAVADEVKNMAESFIAESKILSENLLKCAELERERTLQFYKTIREAVRGTQAIRATFDAAYHPPQGVPISDEAAEAFSKSLEAPL